jgi:NitT/TauT family transport system ATP-binding protein
LTKLEIKNVTKKFRRIKADGTEYVTAIENVNLSVDEGQFVCFVGPSGCGKSTLLNILAGLDMPTEGEVVLNGRPVKETGPDRTMVFQENALFPWLNVIENVEFGEWMDGVVSKKWNKKALIFI